MPDFMTPHEMVEFLNDLAADPETDAETADKLTQVSIFLFTVIKVYREGGRSESSKTA